MKVSIITVCYNSRQTIAETFESVLHQSYSDYEYIVVDGLSNDGTVDIIKKYEPMFSGKMIWLSERDNGIYDAMNKGIMMATGDIIFILNSDDVFATENILNMVVQAFISTNVDIVYSDVYYFSNREKPIRKWIPKIGNVKLGWIPPHPGVFVKRDVYLRKGFFDTNFVIAADYDFLLRVFLDKDLKKIYLPQCTIKMRLGGESTRSIRNVFKGNMEVIKALRKNNVPFPLLAYTLRLLRRISQFLAI